MTLINNCGASKITLLRSATQFAHTCASAVGMHHGISQAHQAEKFVRRLYEIKKA